MSNIKLTIKAKVDGDKCVQVLSIPELTDATIAVNFEIDYRGSVITCETPDDMISLFKLMATSQGKREE